MTKVKTVKQSQFTKQQAYRSEKYKDKRDLINALLEDDKKYMVKDIDELIDDFLKKKIGKEKEV